ncbi:MAG: hypothetical protein OQL11_14205 [Gammaproteobacteria bacterium]|nr:hypothetical protein [Gammaproteobacteria bacterium]
MGWQGALIAAVLLGWMVPAQALLQTGGEAYAWDGKTFAVPLSIRDNSGHGRERWPVTMGVPLPAGVVQDAGTLRLTDAHGRTIPCQFQTLSRHAGRDGSLRWLLLDFQVDLAANATTRVVLRNDGKEQKAGAAITIETTADRIHIDTGPLQADIPRDGGHLLERVTVQGHRILDARSGDGAHLRSGAVPEMERFRGSRWNPAGWNKERSTEKIEIAEADYRSGPPRDVVVETDGPLRSVVRIRGRLLPEGSGRGIVDDGLYNYTVRLTFYQGHPYIQVQYDIENSAPEQPQWMYLFREAGLRHSLVLDGSVQVRGGGQGTEDGASRPTEASLRLPAGKGAWLSQSEPVVTRPDRGHPKIETGRYRFGAGENTLVAAPLAAGKRGRYLAVSDGNKGVALSLRHLWQEGPRALGFEDGRLQVRVHASIPGEDGKRPAYALDFGERSISDLLYHFHGGEVSTERLAAVAEAFEFPLAAHAPPAWYADTDTWYFELSRQPTGGDRGLDTDEHWHPDMVGHDRHAINRSYNAGGHHESLNSGWLSYIRSGKLADWERNLAMSRWSIAHTRGWAYRDNVLAFGVGDDRLARLDAQLREYHRLAGFGPKDFYLWRSGETYTDKTPRGPVERPVGGVSYLNAYKWLPDHEHYALFRLFEYYYLTGDPRALDSIHGFVNWDIYFQNHHLFGGTTRPLADVNYLRDNPEVLHQGHYARVYSWMLYTNLAGLHATASPVFDLYARWQVRRALALLRDRHGQFTRRMRDGAHETDSEGRKIHYSRVQTWMEAQGILALHEAYKTFDDERILDGIWAQADYFSHHVLFFPRLAMMNNRTSMPNKRLGTGQQRGAALTPHDHDRYIQGFPLLYHYTGWPAVIERHQVFQQAAEDNWVRDWFMQTSHWVREQHPKRSHQPPEPITDLEVVRAGRDGIQLRWTSPIDDAPGGRAERYFVKYSDKPIVDFAPTDNPARAEHMQRILRAAEDLVMERRGGAKKISRKDRLFMPGDTEVEPDVNMLAHPRWHEVDAFWMAEHVVGEPAPGPAGSRETFTLEELRPHSWFGLNDNPRVTDLGAGTYYIAVATWDEDRNLSRISNVVEVRLR